MNKIKRVLEPVKASPVLKEELKSNLKMKTYNKGKSPYLKWVLSCVAIILVVSIVFNRSENVVDAAQLTLEGQVQLTLTIDEENKVIEVIGLNDEGQEVIEAVDVKGMEYTRAINEIVNCIPYQKHQQDKTSFSVKCHDQNRRNELMEKATKACRGHQNRHHQG